MVQASTLVIAAFVVAPVIAAPLGVGQESQDSFTRSVEDVSLAVREPFKFGGLLKKIGGVAKTAAKFAAPAASLLLRDEDGSVYELTERDVQDLADLQARDPKFRFGNFLKKAVGTGARIASGLLLRDVDDDLELDARDLEFLAELDERDLLDLEELAAREPFRFGNIIKKVGGIARKAAGVAGTVSRVAGGLGLREFEDDVEELTTRDLEFLDEISERDFEELATREPFRLGNIIKKVGGIARKAAGVAGTVSRVAGGLGLREIDTRDIQFLEELDERELQELATREPFRLGNIIKKVGGIARKAAGVAGTVSRVASGLGLRELDDDEFEAREFIDIDALLERDLDLDLEDLEARFKFGNILRKAGGVVRKVGKVAGTVSNVAGSLGLRELEELD